MAYFDVKCIFVYTMKIHMYVITFEIEDICSQHHTIWSWKKKKSHDDVFVISHTTKVRIYCLLVRFVDVEIDILFNLFINGCMFITCAIENSKECSIAKSASNWAYSQAWRSWTIGVSKYHSLIPTLESNPNMKRRGVFIPKALNLAQFSSNTKHHLTNKTLTWNYPHQTCCQDFSTYY